MAGVLQKQGFRDLTHCDLQTLSAFTLNHV